MKRTDYGTRHDSAFRGCPYVEDAKANLLVSYLNVRICMCMCVCSVRTSRPKRVVRRNHYLYVVAVQESASHKFGDHFFFFFQNNTLSNDTEPSSK